MLPQFDVLIPEEPQTKTWSGIAFVAVLGLILYSLLNGLPLPASLRRSTQPRNYKPLGEAPDAHADGSDDEQYNSPNKR
jgi:hypothetical protein